MAFFFGTYHHNLDSKGRLNLPSQLRRQISNGAANQLLITKGYKGGCLFVYPQDNWQRIMAELESQPRTEENRNALRIFTAESILAELDAQGRIMIPAKFLQETGLVKEAVIVGVSDKMEIWNPDFYQKLLEQNSGLHQELIKKL
ncbi:division/cell wall cluster transcriptional repressor MraZ [candidate division TA06 bacterium]|uniref:Transcriptional regulator MraZ n=1 Tax=candidate division TA06 bacterium TaxID=2250710 RepID=A0A933I8P1_UNCT6|nr:division/cell wall cluster transcriptional repressor MraZ [candidate division TA06 bacterium]